VSATVVITTVEVDLELVSATLTVVSNELVGASDAPGSTDSVVMTIVV
jgi:hypothetical protein